jgi:hypothetical protein
MATVFVFLGILVASQLVAMIAGLQLAIYFGAREEYIAVTLLHVLFAIAALVGFAVAYAFTQSIRAFRIVAFSLAALAVGLVALPGAIQWIANPGRFTVGWDDLPITLEILLPAWAAVLVQWGMVRHRWLRVHGSDTLSGWPWIATVIAGLAIFNAAGLAAAATILSSPSTAALAAALALVVLAIIEFDIRRRVLRRRAAGISPIPA